MQVCHVSERAISWQVHVSLVLMAFGPLISFTSWEGTNRNKPSLGTPWLISAEMSQGWRSVGCRQRELARRASATRTWIWFLVRIGNMRSILNRHWACRVLYALLRAELSVPKNRNRQIWLHFQIAKCTSQVLLQGSHKNRQNHWKNICFFLRVL